MPSNAPALSASSTPTPAPVGVAKEDFDAALIEIECGGYQHCCEADGAPTDLEGCKQGRRESNAVKKGLETAAAYTPELGAACLAEAREATKGCGGYGLEGPACRAAFAGTTPLGKPCENGTDCAADPRGKTYCGGEDDEGHGGRCMVQTPPKLGAACWHFDAGTPPGDEVSGCYEDPTLMCSRDRKCVVRAELGGACETHTDCKSATCWNKKCVDTTGRTCEESRDCGADHRCREGKCAEGGKLGEPCGSITDCGKGTTCASATRTCVSHAARIYCRAPK